jgi:hypothetical protein
MAIAERLDQIHSEILDRAMRLITNRMQLSATEIAG